MTPDEAALVLTKAAAFDLRTIVEVDAIVWAEALDDVELDDALDAVTRHYRETEQRLMPANIRRHVDQMVRERWRTAITAARLTPMCDHGDPGGASLHPQTGEPLCPQCRRGLPTRHEIEPPDMPEGPHRTDRAA